MDIPIAKIIRSRRRTIALEIQRDASLIVRAPVYASEGAILDIVRRKRVWIDQKQRLARERFEAIPRRQFIDGEALHYLGKAYALRTVPGPAQPLLFNDAFLLSEVHRPRAKQVIIEWYRREARSILHERVESLARTADLSYNSIRITSAFKRWGSCGPNGSLSFSWRLIMAPMEVIDYVVAHEIAHLVHKNHSRRFWEKVAVLFPEYRSCREWLKNHGHLLVV
jgi:predicted metal-dependent hydrolase